MYEKILGKIDDEIGKKKKGYYKYVIIPKNVFFNLIEHNMSIGIFIPSGKEELFGVSAKYTDKLNEDEYILVAQEDA